MTFYLRRFVNGTDSLLFVIQDAAGEILYRVEGMNSKLSGEMCLLNAANQPVAWILRVGTASLSKFNIEIPGRKRTVVVRNLTVPGGSFVMRFPSWQLRGLPVSGCFDLVDVDRSVVLTHGMDWKENVCCIQILKEENVVLGLCVCILLNETISGGICRPVAVQEP